MSNPVDLLYTLQYGTPEDKAEALTLVRGVFNEGLVCGLFDKDRRAAIQKSVAAGAVAQLEERELQRVLRETANDKNAMLSWYANLVLCERWGTTSAAVGCLWGARGVLVQKLQQLQESGTDLTATVSSVLTERAVDVETLRAVANLGKTPDASRMIHEFLGAGALEANAEEVVDAVICAIGASGDESLRPVVERFATDPGKSQFHGFAQAAKALWGKGTFDQIRASKPKESSKAGCFIATVCYGGYESPEVLILRRYRDEKLYRTRAGRAAIHLYYGVSPRVAGYLEKRPRMVTAVRRGLDPVVRYIQSRHGLSAAPEGVSHSRVPES